MIFLIFLYLSYRNEKVFSGPSLVSRAGDEGWT